jgi:thiamine transport system permease protein
MGKRLGRLIGVFPLSFILFFYMVPVFYLLIRSISFESLNRTLSLRVLPNVIYFTIYQAVMTTIVCVVIGTIFGYILARSNIYFNKTLSAAIIVPFLMPPISMIIGFVVLFGSNGLIVQILGLSQPLFSVFRNPLAIIMAHSLYNIPLVTRLVCNSFQTESLAHHEVADTFSKSRLTKLKLITIPHIRSTVMASALLTFLYSFNSFAIVLLLGQVRYQTIEVLIYSRVALLLDFQTAFALSLLQIIFNTIFIIIYLFITRRQQEIVSFTYFVPRYTIWKRVGSTLIMILFVIVLWSPIIATLHQFIYLFTTATEGEQLRLVSGAYLNVLGTSPIRVILNSIFLGFSTALLAVFLSLSIMFAIPRGKSYEAFSSYFLILPMVTSTVTLGVAILISYGFWRLFTQNIWIFLLVSHCLAALPFTSRALLNAWRELSSKLLEVANIYSNSNIKILKDVVFPLLKSAILVSFLFAFAISLGEFGTSFLIARGEWVTLAVAIGRLFTTQSSLLPTFFALLLSLVSFLVFFIIERFAQLELKI